MVGVTTIGEHFAPKTTGRASKPRRRGDQMEEPATTTVKESSGVKHNLASQFGWVSGGRILGALVQAMIMVLLARWAGPVGFGTVGIALSLVLVLQTGTDLGLPTYIVRERAARPSSQTIRRALEINNSTARWMAVLLLAIFITVGLLLQPMFLQLLPLAIWAAVDRNTDTWAGVRLADGDAWMNTLTQLSRRCSAALVMIGMYALGVAPLLAFSIALSVVGVIVNVVVHRWILKRLPEPLDRPHARPIIRASFPYWVNATATQLRNLDALMVGVMTGSAQVAFYAAASKITGPLRIMPTSLAALLVPSAARLGVMNLRPILRPILLVLSAMCVIYGSVILSAPWAVPWALGPDFAGAVFPVQIVCAGLIFAACASILTAILQGIGKGASVARIAVVTTGACLLGVFIGALANGAVGAAVSLASSFALQAAALTWILRRERQLMGHTRTETDPQLPPEDKHPIGARNEIR